VENLTVVGMRFIADSIGGTVVIWSPRIRVTVPIKYAELIILSVCAYEAVDAAPPRIWCISRWVNIQTLRHVAHSLLGTCGGLIPKADRSVGENDAQLEVSRIRADNAALASA
jgi:hypothetical protein